MSTTPATINIHGVIVMDPDRWLQNLEWALPRLSVTKRLRRRVAGWLRRAARAIG